MGLNPCLSPTHHSWITPCPIDPFRSDSTRKKISCPPSDNECGSRYKNHQEPYSLGSIKPNENPSSQNI
jgi:hypothetical protein